MKYYIFTVIVFAALIGCTKENSNDTCVEEEFAYATNVQAPSTGTINQDVEIEIDFNIKNSCGNFNGFKESAQGNSRIIRVSTLYEGCRCLQVVEKKTATYIFNTSVPGDYELKFVSAEGDYIVVELTIV